MYKFIVQLKYIVLIIILGLVLSSCGNPKETHDIVGHWVMEQVVYDDGSVNRLEAGNFIDINADTIVEVIKNHGNRQYSYNREGDTITLNNNVDEHITWKIVNKTDNNLELATPIGKYILSRK